MIKKLIEQRVEVYIQNTKEITSLYEEELKRAIRFFTKTDKDMQITSVYLYPTNPNFIVNVCKLSVAVGDKLETPTGEVIEVTQENLHQVTINDIITILPEKVLESKSAIRIYENIAYMKKFSDQYGDETLDKVLSSGITEFDDMLKTEHEELLEIVTAPPDEIEKILESLDDLQRVQYNIFIADKNRQIH